VVTKATGAYTYTLANGQANVQALADGQQVTEVFTYTDSDNHGGSSASTLTVTVTGSNDAPVAVADVAALTEDALPNIANGNLLTNDTDVDSNDTHTVSALSGGTDNGTTITKVGTYGTLVVTKATGTYTYTLANGQANVQALADGQQVTDVFTYTNSDNHLGGSSAATLTVTVTGSNEAPVAVADVAAVKEDTNTAAQPNPVSGNLLTNDTDVDSLDTHTVSALSGGTDNGTTITKVGTYGTLVVTKATGTYSQRPGQRAGTGGRPAGHRRLHLHECRQPRRLERIDPDADGQRQQRRPGGGGRRRRGDGGRAAEPGQRQPAGQRHRCRQR
jgi:VCBS repeat-containing protein